MIYPKAYTLARNILKRLSTVCERVEIVGSVKRTDSDPNVARNGCHDLEFLLIPTITPQSADLFGVALNEGPWGLDNLIADMKADGTITDPKHIRKADGSRLKKFSIVGEEWEDSEGRHDFCMELYIVTPRTWAIQNVIRTGPRIFSHRFVTSDQEFCYPYVNGAMKSYKGLLPHYYQYVKKGKDEDSDEGTEIRIRGSGEVLDLREEADAIKLLGLGEGPAHWVPADQRYMYT